MNYQLFRYTKSEDSDVNNLEIFIDEGKYKDFADAYYSLIVDNQQMLKQGDVFKLICDTHECYYLKQDFSLTPMGCDKR